MKLITTITLLLTTSCASIVAGSNSDVQVISNPPGLEFRTDTGLHGVTPQLVSLPNGRTVNFMWEVNGTPGSTTSKPHISGWIAGNILFGGILGIIVDVVNPQARVHKDELFIGPVTAAMIEQQRLEAERREASANDDNF